MLFLVARGVAGGPRVGALSALGVETANARLRRRHGARADGGARRIVRLPSPSCRYAGARLPRPPRRPHAARAGRGAAHRSAPAGSLRPWTSWRQGSSSASATPRRRCSSSRSSRSSSTPRPVRRGRRSSCSARSSSPSGRCSTCPTGCSAGWSARGWRDASSRGLRRGRIARRAHYIGLGGLTAATGHRAA